MNQTTFNYNNNIYLFKYIPADLSELWCIDEIVRDNDYLLNRFNNYINKIFIDIGANCGVATIILAKQNPLSTIYSFEPDSKVFEVLSENVKINNLTNVKLFNMAVAGNNISLLELCHHPLYSGGNTTYSDTKSFNDFFKANAIISEVKALSFDDIFNDNNIDEVELLKIDCEGAEFDIIYDSINFKNKKVKNMVGEFHNLSYNNKVKNKAEDLLEFSKSFIDGIFNIRILNVN